MQAHQRRGPLIWFNGKAKLISPIADIVDRDGNSIIAGKWNTSSVESISAGGTVTSSDSTNQQYRRVQGSGGAVTLSNTPFGTSLNWIDGTIIRLVGWDDTNTITVQNNDITDGSIVNGTATLTRFDMLDLQYDSTVERWIEVGRNF